MSDNEKKVGLPKPPLFTSDYIAMAEILQFAMERFGQLILALMYYTTDGTMPDNLPSDISMMFAIYQRKIDAAREKYEQKCLNNAKNGAKGGRPRKKTTSTLADQLQPTDSESAKKSKATPKVKMPPTRERFAQLIETGQAEGNISDECDPDEIFDWAETLKWKVNGEPAKNVGDFLAYAAARYPVKDTIDATFQSFQLSHVYAIIFKEFHGLRDSDGNTGALAAAIDFLKAYDSGWSFHGQTFTNNQWKEALSLFMQDLKDK